MYLFVFSLHKRYICLLLKHMRTAYSHAFFVGNLPDGIKLSVLKKSLLWEHRILSEDEFGDACSYFHKSHINAMQESEAAKKPRFLKNVRHYVHNVDKSFPLSLITNGTLKVLDMYYLKIVRLHIYTFPLNFTLFAIEIDDTGSDLNEMTLAHSWLRDIPSRLNSFGHSGIKESLEPLLKLIPTRKNKSGNEQDERVKELMDKGNKLKIFQVVHIDEFNDNLLYEIGTCSKIEAVGSSDIYAPSGDYFRSIMKENTVAPFLNWKGLALKDSFTVLFSGECGEYKKSDYDSRWCGSYFPLIYLRVVFQSVFLFSRDEGYRRGTSSGNVVRELSKMEKYYFYDDISFNFLPNMLNSVMEKGLGIAEARKEVSTQIKETEDRNTNIVFGVVSVFAVLSVAYDFYSMLIVINCAWATKTLAICISVVAIMAIIFVIWLLRSRKSI